MHRPIVVSVEHYSTKEEVLRKLRTRFAEIREQIAPFVSSVTREWTESGVTVLGNWRREWDSNPRYGCP